MTKFGGLAWRAKISSPHNCPSIEKRKINNNNKTADMITPPLSSMFDAEIKTNATHISTFCIVCLIRIPLLLYSYYTIHFSNKDIGVYYKASKLSRGCVFCSQSFCHFILEYIFFISMQPPWIELHPFVPLLSNVLYIVVLF